MDDAHRGVVNFEGAERRWGHRGAQPGVGLVSIFSRCHRRKYNLAATVLVRRSRFRGASQRQPRETEQNVAPTVVPIDLLMGVGQVGRGLG